MKKILALLLLLLIISVPHARAATKTGSTGLEGVVPGNPPTQAATIGIPHDGQVFTSIPINVGGLCPDKTVVEIYKNNVFAGAVPCSSGSYSLLIDLFEGSNSLIARVYDDLNQAGPDSNTVTVTFNSALPSKGPRISLTTEFSKRGANPGESLTWPLTLSGGSGPYAISINWGDQSKNELISRSTAGNFTIEHIYSKSGVYNITVTATDANGESAFLQVVGVGNGPIQLAGTNKTGQSSTIQKQVLWLPIIALAVLTIAAFWLGRQHQLEVIRARLRRGERAFK
ncbi:MAG TPA: PKD domain-containing protein [Candidatus Saccharimonadales bacterium]|nr:PKD domain-containing protein [Candidatus Saccharimonadales bacterium]